MGLVGGHDVRRDPDVLVHQAEVARRHGNPQLAENLLRAAELTALPYDQVLELYETLRPGRAEAARHMRFLLDDDATFVTGQAFVADGGELVS